MPKPFIVYGIDAEKCSIRIRDGAGLSGSKSRTACTSRSRRGSCTARSEQTRLLILRLLLSLLHVADGQLGVLDSLAGEQILHGEDLDLGELASAEVFGLVEAGDRSFALHLPGRRLQAD